MFVFKQLFTFFKLRCSIGLHHLPDVVSNHKYTLLWFSTTNFFFKEKKASAFDRERYCNLMLWLWLIFILYDYSWHAGVLNRIHNISFTLQLKNWPNNLECNVTLSCKDLPETNTKAYSANMWVMKKLKCCEYVPLAF